MSSLENRMQDVLKEANNRGTRIDITISPTGSWMFLLQGTWLLNTAVFEEGIAKLEQRFGIQVKEEINRDEENAARWKHIREVAEDKGTTATFGNANGRTSILLPDRFGMPRTLQGKDYSETLTLAEEALGIKT